MSNTSNTKLRFRDNQNNSNLQDEYDKSNQQYANYNLINFKNNDKGRNDYIDSLDELGISANNNRNNYDTYVDTESKLKKGSLTNIKDKNNKLLRSRPFITSPYMGAGSGNKNINSNNKIGIDTTTKKSNGSFADLSLNRFTPLVPHLSNNIQNVKILFQNIGLMEVKVLEQLCKM